MSKKTTILSIAALGALVLLGVGCVKKGSSTTAPLPPSISFSEQSLSADNQLVVNKAIVDSDGWIVIQAKENGRPGTVLGYTSLLTGGASKIKITIDKTNITPSVFAVLYYDRGIKGAFEYLNGDGPVIRDQKVIMQEANITNYAEVTKESSQTRVSARKEFIITAKQWSFSPAEIKVKKGDMVVLKLKSADVAHGFSLPDFGINAPIKPGELKTVEFTADKIGTFKFVCNVPCGVGHMGMTGTIVVEE